MNTYLKPFELTLRCLGPVFIGSGEKRTSKSTTWRATGSTSRTWNFFTQTFRLTRGSLSKRSS